MHKLKICIFFLSYHVSNNIIHVVFVLMNGNIETYRSFL